MNKTGHIQIRIKGFNGNIELTPDNYDIRELIGMLQIAEDLLYPTNKKNRPIISYQVEEGSVNHLFKTSIQYIIGFNALVGQIAKTQNIDFLDINTAKAFESIQETATKKNYTIEIKTSLEKSSVVKLDRTTHFYRTEVFWADAEFYFYGKVTNAGGKDKANIHILTEEMGTVRIQTPILFLEDYENNLLYKTFGVRAKGKQHSETGEIDLSSLEFIELIDYEIKYDEAYLKNLRNKAKNNWLGRINSDDWLKEIRGYEG